MSTLALLVLFIVGIGLGHKVIRKVPTLLHTPLMSGMNALSGVTAVGALLATASAIGIVSRLLAALAVVLAITNVVGGFLVTHRMLAMFKSDDLPPARQPNQ